MIYTLEFKRYNNSYLIISVGNVYKNSKLRGFVGIKYKEKSPKLLFNSFTVKNYDFPN